MSTGKKTAKSTDVIVGLDFGTTKICVTIGKPTDSGIEIVGIGKHASLGIRKGVVVNIPSTVDAIKKAANTAKLMAGVEIKSAIAGIAGHHIKGFNSAGVVAVKHREVTKEDVDRAIDAAKAVALGPDREILHVIPQEFIVNDQDGVRDPIGMSGVRLESKVHIVTSSVSSAENIIKCAEMAGIPVSDLVLEPLASAEAVLTEDEKELGVAIVDIGGGTTDVAVFARGSVVHTGVIAMGGNHITNDIAVGLRTSIADAEMIKVSSGSAMASASPSDQVIEVPAVGARKPREVSRAVLTKIIEPRVEEILSLVNQELVASGYKHLLSAGVVFTGGASQLEGLMELAEFTFELPVRRGMPIGVGGLADVVNSPVYSTSVGLLQCGLKKKAEMSFKPSDHAAYSKVVSRMKTWLGQVFQ